MTCAINGNIEIDFIGSDIQIEAYEVSTRSSSFKFSHAEIDISREDGERINNNVDGYEPVVLKLGGVVQDRYLFDPNAITLRNDGADLVLHDAEKILQRGTINKNFQNTTVRDVIDYLLDRREDPHNVIQDVEHPEDSVQNLPVEEQNQNMDNILRLVDSFVDPAGVVGLTTKIKPPDTSVQLNDGTPHEGVQKVTNNLALSTWVDSNGTFKYGLQGAEARNLNVDETDSGARLKEYNVTVGSGSISRVILKGPYQVTLNEQIENDARVSATFVFGEAWLEDPETGEELGGATFEPKEVAQANTLDGIRDAAERTLISHYMSRKEGNIVLNAGSTIDSEPLANLAVGDIISASPTIENNCIRDVETGIFKISKIQHKLDQRRGWIVTLSVSALPVDSIKKKAYKHDTESDTTWDEVDDGEEVPAEDTPEDDDEETPRDGLDFDDGLGDEIDRVGDIYDGLKTDAGDLVREGRAEFNEITAYAGGLYDDATNEAGELIDRAEEGFDQLADETDSAVDFAETKADDLTDSYNSLVDDAQRQLDEFGSDVDDAIDDTTDAIGNAVDDVQEGVGDAADSISDAWDEATDGDGKYW